jgi:hypothetical protein
MDEYMDTYDKPGAVAEPANRAALAGRRGSSLLGAVL